MSSSHTRVVRLLEAVGVEASAVQLATGLGLPSIDIAIRGSQGEKYGIQVMSHAVNS
jgi:hypothetical protein